MPEIPVTINAAGKRWLVVIDADTPQAALADAWDAVNAGTELTAEDEFGIRRRRITWKPETVTDLSAVDA